MGRQLAPMPRRRGAAVLCSALLALLAAEPILVAGGSGLRLISVAHADDDGAEGAGPGSGDTGRGAAPDSGRDGVDNDGSGSRTRPRVTEPFRWPWERRSATTQDPPGTSPPRQGRPPGPPAAASVPNEVVISGLDAAALQRLADERFQVLAQRTMASRPSIIARVRVPNGMPMPRALSRARELAPGAAVDRNHVFSNTFLVQTGPQAARRAFANPLAAVAWPKDASCSEDARIGIVDTGIDPEHPTLKDKSIERETVRGPDLAPSSTDHGTAVATLLVGDGHFAGLAPGARLIAVDAFHRHENRDRADAFDLVSAIELLVERKVSVINLSLAGGANELLDRAGKEALAKNVLIVAAVGNEGPASPPLYPAAYSWAVAVTAVDDGRIAYARAVRGRHVSFAAPGVRLAVDDGNGQARTLSGTSFAAPFLTAAIAQLRGAHPDLTPAEVVSALTGRVVDLGAPGRDNIFGWGLLHLANRCTLRPARE